MYSDIRIANPNVLESRIGAIESRVDTLNGVNARDDVAGGGDHAHDRARTQGPIGHLDLAECCCSYSE